MDNEEKEKEALQQNGEATEDKTEEAEPERETWGGKLDFVMSALSFAVGMGNLWRFPYLCYRNGGGAFLIPYVIMMIFAGLPMMFLELSFGQYGRQGVVSIWKACPIFTGVGWAMFFVSGFVAVYYNMLCAWCIYYIAASFAKDVPWKDCNNAWNTPSCATIESTLARNNCTNNNGTWFNSTCIFVENVGEKAYSVIVGEISNETTKRVSPSEDYFHHRMLGISDGIENLGGIQWEIALCYLFCWLIVILCLSKGIQTSGKATYVTACFPYVVLVILFIRGILLDGAADGIIFYLRPQFKPLLSARVWGDAAVQVFFSLSSCWGGLITLASYNKFHTNIFRDSIVVATGDFLTSIFGGVVIFSFIGYMSHKLSMPVDEVLTSGAGLAFIVYPEAVTTLPISPLWSILFMLMLINVGIGSQFTLVTTVQTTLMDEFPKVFKKTKWHPILLLLGICGLSFTIGLAITTNGGIYVLQMLDSYSATYSVIIIAISILIAIGWVYGADRMLENIEEMIGFYPGKFWLIVWKFISPVLLLGILLFTIVDFKRMSYGTYQFPVWCEIFGWFLTCIQIGCIPGVAIYKIYHTDSSLSIRERIAYLSRPTPDWGSASEKAKIQGQAVELTKEEAV